MRAVRTFAAVVAAVLLLTGCGNSITGTPLPEGAGMSVGGSDRFDKLLRECEAVPNEKIAEVLGGDGIDQYFYGAVCMWTVLSHAGSLDVTFGWFENNALQRERDVADRLGYQVETTSVAGASAFTARRPGDSATCGITAAYSGVITWWVQNRSGTGDPCAGARTLAELTLQRNQ